MRVKITTIFFLLLIALIPLAYAADFGEDKDYLGQVVDDYENADNIATMIDMIQNATLDCMELDTFIGPVYENYTTFTEWDPDNVLEIEDFKVNMIGLRRNHDTYLYKDMGVDYFDDFEHNVTMFKDYSELEHGSYNGIWGVSNDIDDGLGLADGFIVFGGNDKTAPENSYIYLKDMSGAGEDPFVEPWSGDVTRYLTIKRDGVNLSCKIYSDAERTILLDTLTRVVGNEKLRYLYGAFSYNTGHVFASTGFNENLWIGSYGDIYEETGSYYTSNVLNGDPAIAILYNSTIPSGANVTMEFSTDNVTWVDHNNKAGSDTLIAGYEALDLRDIYSGTLYRRVNMTSDGSDTPRMMQARFVTVTTITAGGGLFPGLAIGIALLIIGAIIALEKRR